METCHDQLLYADGEWLMASFDIIPPWPLGMLSKAEYGVGMPVIGYLVIIGYTISAAPIGFVFPISSIIEMLCAGTSL